ncbi:hypothetical protein [Hymenobacter wooponensis]|uniref:GAF domain-containing protein n=1 Tax=Hymenobacter wooponensis TaxID=1525360 RepID=A0A4Z0MVB6_9BACT|nr:hypothetical protein [Hymenobacter wooponensis]TGD83248.1 hypothetical protein EU557_05570 [Hymenobacter wooponensis]
MSTNQEQQPIMHREIGEFESTLRQQGIHAALKYLNHRTPHQYTGIFRFDGDMLRNEVLFDRYNPQLLKGNDTPMVATYCSLVGRQEAPLEITDAATDTRVKGLVDTPVVSYCGVLIRDATGKAFGTLCHYDMQRCEERTTDLPLLQAAAEMLYRHLRPHDAHA